MFCGGCTPAAAEQVTRATRNHLDALTEKNLLVRGDGRYAMLDTIRELANEQLEASCEADAIRATHAACYLQLGEQTMPETKALQGLSHERTEQLAVLIGSELDNLRAAFRWFVDHDQPEQALQVHLGMSLIWAQGGRDDEAQHGCREALAANGDLSDLTKGRALLLYGSNLVLGDRGLEAEPVLFEALDVVRRLGARRERQRGTALVLRMLALVASGAGNLDRARHFFEQALSIDPEDEDVANMLLYGLGSVEIDAGNLSRARTLIADALTRARRSQQFLSELWCLSLLADLDRLESSLDRAEAGYQQSLRLAQSIAWHRAIWPCLGGLAAVALARGDLQRAGRLWGAMQESLEEQGTKLFPTFRHRYEPLLDTRCEPPFQRGLDEGRKLSLDQGIAYALGESS